MTTDPAETPIRVGIGLVARAGRYLIRRRPEGSAMAGLWEFPGGKCEPGEGPEAATARECREETGFDVAVGALLRRIIHRYPHGLVELSYYPCEPASPDAEPASGSGFAWVEADALPNYRFPEANGPILATLARGAGRVDVESTGPEAGRS